MDDFLVVGEADDFRNLPHQIEPHIDTELIFVLCHEVIEPEGQRIMLEDQCRAKLVVRIPLAPQNGLVL